MERNKPNLEGSGEENAQALASQAFTDLVRQVTGTSAMRLALEATTREIAAGNEGLRFDDENPHDATPATYSVTIRATDAELLMAGTVYRLPRTELEQIVIAQEQAGQSAQQQ